MRTTSASRICGKASDKASGSRGPGSASVQTGPAVRAWAAQAARVGGALAGHPKLSQSSRSTSASRPPGAVARHPGLGQAARAHRPHLRCKRCAHPTASPASCGTTTASCLMLSSAKAKAKARTRCVAATRTTMMTTTRVGQGPVGLGRAASVGAYVSRILTKLRNYSGKRVVITQCCQNLRGFMSCH